MLTFVDILSNYISDMVEKFKIYEIIAMFSPYIPSLYSNLAKYDVISSFENRFFPQIFSSVCF